MKSNLYRLASLISICCVLIVMAGCKEETHVSEAHGFDIDEDVAFEEHDYENIVPANNMLGMDILSSIEPDEHNNRFISPLSLFSALSMAYIGSDGETKDEIAQAMHIHDFTDDDIKKGHAALYDLLSSMPEEITLDNANALWIDNSFSTQDDYSETLQKYYNALFQSDDFSNDATADHINDWIEEQTNGKITDMVDAPIDESVVLFLLNTLYFQADWAHPFDPALTADDTFHTDEGDQTVSMMSLSEDLLYTDTNDYQAVVLPYEDGEIEMNIFLPHEDSSLDEMMDTLQDMNWIEWKDSLRKEAGTVRLPSFEIEFETNLNAPLQELGMQQAFTEHAEFPHMIDGNDPLEISNVLQKSVIIVDEKGTEAASATSVEMEVTSAPAAPPFHMEVNRPFLFTINESSSGTVLFMGTINDPTPVDEDK